MKTAILPIEVVRLRRRQIKIILIILLDLLHFLSYSSITLIVHFLFLLKAEQLSAFCAKFFPFFFIKKSHLRQKNLLEKKSFLSSI